MIIETIHTVFLNHKFASMELLELASITDDKKNQVLENLKVYTPISEAIVISTCNRVEFWLVSQEGDTLCKDTLIDVVYFWLSESEKDQLKAASFLFSEELALMHMFQVSSSLDSMVIGEREIFGQVKKSFEEAKKEQLLGRVMTEVFNHLSVNSKKVYSQTRIANKKISVASLACEKLREELKTNSPRIGLVGAGATIELIAKYLKGHSLKGVKVFNRSINKAQRIAESLEGQAYSISEVKDYVQDFDVIISCTGSPNYILNAKDFVLCKQNLVLVDLAVPRDLDPQVAEQKNVTLIDVFSLQEEVESNVELRKKELSKAKVYLSDSLKNIIQKFKEVESIDSIRSSLFEIENILEDKYINRLLADLSDKDRKASLDILHYLQKKLIRDNVLMAKRTNF